MNFDFAGFGVTLDNVKDFEAALAEYKKSLREAGKQATADRKASAVDACNAAISDGSIVKGATVVVMYNKTEVVGEITNTPTVDAKNLPVSSDAFANKDKFLYVPKQNFVRMG